MSDWSGEFPFEHVVTLWLALLSVIMIIRGFTLAEHRASIEYLRRAMRAAHARLDQLTLSNEKPSARWGGFMCLHSGCTRPAEFSTGENDLSRPEYCAKHIDEAIEQRQLSIAHANAKYLKKGDRPYE